MYWQVYLHKTVICAEQMLIKILKRAKYLAKSDVRLFATPALEYFLYHDFDTKDFIARNEVIEKFAQLDDHDIMTSIKIWQKSDDKVLSYLCSCLVNRKLFKIELENEPISPARILLISEKVKARLNISDENDLQYFVFHDSTSNSAYLPEGQNINIKFRSGKIVDVANASDHLNLAALSDTVVKHYLCYPKEINQDGVYSA